MPAAGDRQSGFITLLINCVSTAGHKCPNGAGVNYGGNPGNNQLLWQIYSDFFLLPECFFWCFFGLSVNQSLLVIS